MNSRLHMGRTSIGVTDFSPWRKQLALTLVDKKGLELILAFFPERERASYFEKFFGLTHLPTTFDTTLDTVYSLTNEYRAWTLENATSACSNYPAAIEEDLVDAVKYLQHFQERWFAACLRERIHTCV